MRRSALLIGNATYQRDRSLAPLTSPPADVAAVAEVLARRGGFEVESVVDGDRDQVVKALEALYAAKSSEDTVLVYFSCHGVVDDDDRLYFAAADTEIGHWDATAVDAEVVRRLMANCRAGRKIALLDCCFSGAFGDAAYVRRGGFRAPVQRRLQERGTFVLTASTRLQPAHEPRGGEPGGSGLSVFTEHVVAGLEGGAGDRDGDGWIAAQDLADYVQAGIARHGIGQSPSVFNEGVTGPIRICRVDQDAASAPVGTGTAGAGTGAAYSARAAAPVGQANAFRWRDLLGYYRDCLATEAALDALVDLQDRHRYAVWPGGAEPLFCGDGDPVPPPEAVQAVIVPGGTSRPDQEHLLIYGYPGVIVGGPGSDRRPQLAALLEVEAERDAQGRLTAIARARLNRSLLRQWGMPDEEIEELAEHVDDHFVAGDAAALGRLATEVAKVADIPVRATLDPSRLAPRLRLQPFQNGLQNVALVYRVDPKDRGPLRGVLEDYDKTLLTDVGGVGDTALGALDTGDQAVTGWNGHLVAPVPLNEAQEEIVAAAMTHRLTVATGPPGTGKSQLVTALVATATAAGQKVLVVSTNNRAVDEVARRCDELAPGLLIRTGAREYRDREPELLTGLLRTYQTRGDVPTTEARSRLAHRRLEAERDRLDQRHAVERDLGELAEARRRLREEFQGRPAVLALTDAEEGTGPWPRRVTRARRHRLLGWPDRRRIARRLGVGPDGLTGLDRLLRTELLWRDVLAEERDLPPVAETWERTRTLATRTVPDNDAAYLRAHLATVLSEPGARAAIEDRIRLLDQDPRKSWAGFRRLLRALPGWATTTHSARGLKPDPHLFDLVIVDEAAQCSAAVVLPVLYRASRALIIGDPHQLPPVVTLTEEDERAVAGRHRLDTGWLHERRLSHRTGSAFEAFAAAAGHTRLLDEHYRCHPEIIAVPNREVYGDRLTVLTDVRRLAARVASPVDWIDVRGSVVHPDGGSGRNDAEAAAVCETVRRLSAEHPGAGVGVVTPFVAQARQLRRLFERSGLDPDLIGTVHRFQGGERDFIVVSPVGAPGIRRRSRDWLVTQNNLWNVAITRARSGLVVVGDRHWWTGQATGLIAGVAAAGAAPAATRSALSREATDLLQAALEERGLTVTRAATVGGQCCDLYVPGAGAGTAVLVDVADEHTTGRSLRQTLARMDLVEGEGVRILRVPLWRCLHDAPAVAAMIG